MAFSWRQELAQVRRCPPGPRAPSPAPRPPASVCPGAAPRLPLRASLISRGQWRPQVLPEDWAQQSFCKSVPGESLPSPPPTPASLPANSPPPGGLSCGAGLEGPHQAVDKAELC